MHCSRSAIREKAALNTLSASISESAYKSMLKSTPIKYSVRENRCNSDATLPLADAGVIPGVTTKTRKGKSEKRRSIVISTAQLNKNITAILLNIL
jgi:hypothetical protein